MTPCSLGQLPLKIHTLELTGQRFTDLWSNATTSCVNMTTGNTGERNTLPSRPPCSWSSGSRGYVLASITASDCLGRRCCQPLKPVEVILRTVGSLSSKRYWHQIFYGYVYSKLLAFSTYCIFLQDIYLSTRYLSFYSKLCTNRWRWFYGFIFAIYFLETYLICSPR